MFRGQGVGNDVFQILEKEFRQTTNEMIIGTLEGNKAAIRFYQRAGFVPMKDSPPGFVNFHKPISSNKSF
jgi:ribosomal protein S18 acetylase RimI-like enzyme